jgi:hypothetical protein
MDYRETWSVYNRLQETYTKNIMTMGKENPEGFVNSMAATRAAFIMPIAGISSYVVPVINSYL